jgi:hypothetical protein
MKLRGGNSNSNNRKSDSQNSNNIFKFNENGSVNILRESTAQVLN